jgi:hypothetical protein
MPRPAYVSRSEENYHEKFADVGVGMRYCYL